MKRKAPLTLMELMVMIAVFALASALCLQAFVTSDRMSHRAEDRDRAAVLCQSVAECIKHYNGNLPLALEKAAGEGSVQGDGFGYFASFDEGWQVLPREDGSGDPAYTIRLTELPCDVAGLGRASVEVLRGTENSQKSESLFSLEISWQKEVTSHG